MNYLSKQDIEILTDDDLDTYYSNLVKAQSKIISVMDDWILYHGIAANEYNRRKGLIFIPNESKTLH